MFGRGVNESNDTLITRASAFGSGDRWVRPSIKDDPNLGSDQIKSDNFCLVLLRGRTSSQSKSRPVFMMLCKYTAFGALEKITQLNLFIPRDSQYRALITVIKVEQYANASKDECVRPFLDNTNDIICELRNVDSSCIQPILILTEDVADVDSVIPTSQSFLKMNNLSVAFKHMTEKGKHHDYKNETIPPIHVYGKVHFHTTTTLTRLGEVVVCNICSPPMTISQYKYNATVLQRAIRCHAAIHNLKTHTSMATNEPCTFCLLTCHATVKIKKKNLNDLLKEGSAIKLATPVLPNCQTYGAELGREVLFKCFKPVAGFPCTNKPVYCKLCQDFVWA